MAADRQDTVITSLWQIMGREVLMHSFIICLLTYIGRGTDDWDYLYMEIVSVDDRPIKVEELENAEMQDLVLIFIFDQLHTSYYKSSSVCLFVCLSVCLFVPYLLRGPLTDLRQTWWVYVGGPRNCP